MWGPVVKSFIYGDEITFMIKMAKTPIFTPPQYLHVQGVYVIVVIAKFEYTISPPNLTIPIRTRTRVNIQ